MTRKFVGTFVCFYCCKRYRAYDHLPKRKVCPRCLAKATQRKAKAEEARVVRAKSSDRPRVMRVNCDHSSSGFRVHLTDAEWNAFSKAFEVLVRDNDKLREALDAERKAAKQAGGELDSLMKDYQDIGSRLSETLDAIDARGHQDIGPGATHSGTASECGCWRKQPF